MWSLSSEHCNVDLLTKQAHSATPRSSVNYLEKMSHDEGLEYIWRRSSPTYGKNTAISVTGGLQGLNSSRPRFLSTENKH